MVKSPSHACERVVFYLIFRLRNYPQAGGTRPGCQPRLGETIASAIILDRRGFTNFGQEPVSHLVFYQLMLIALLWLFLMLSCVWPSEPAAARPIPPTPVTPPRKRSTAAKPFPGLIRQPHCDASAQAVASHPEPPCAPSPRLSSTRGRRRQVDTSRH